MTKEQAYELATRKNLSDPNGTRMDVIYLAMELYATSKDREIERLKEQLKLSVVNSEANQSTTPTDKKNTGGKAPDVRQIVEHIFYSPATNGQAEESIKNGVELIQTLLKYNNDRRLEITQSRLDDFMGKVGELTMECHLKDQEIERLKSELATLQSSILQAKSMNKPAPSPGGTQ